MDTQRNEPPSQFQKIYIHSWIHQVQGICCNRKYQINAMMKLVPVTDKFISHRINPTLRHTTKGWLHQSYRRIDLL